MNTRSQTLHPSSLEMAGPCAVSGVWRLESPEIWGGSGGALVGGWALWLRYGTEDVNACVVCIYRRPRNADVAMLRSMVDM